MGNVPKLRFPQFSEEWEEKKYNEIYSFYSTNSFSREKLNYENGEVKNIHYGDIHTKFKTMFNLEKEYVPFINQDIDISKIKEENYCQVGDLVIADASEDYNDIGKTIEVINLNNKKILAGLHTFLARPNKYNMALGYIGYLLQSWKVRKQVMTISQGTKVLSLSTSRLGNVNLDIPHKQEQEKIASFLSAVDKKIEKLEEKIALQEKYKKAMMQKLFSQEIRFKADDGSDFPAWEEKKLSELVLIQRGASPRPIEKFINKIGINWIKIGDIKEGEKYIKHTKQKITEEGAKKSRIIKPNDFVLSNSMSFGRPYISKIHGCIHDGWLLMRNIDDGKLSNNYLYEILSSPIIKKQFKRLAAGSTVNNLKSETVRTIKLQLPNIIEQQKIANFLSALDKKIEATKKQKQKAQEFKKGLLQQMFV